MASPAIRPLPNAFNDPPEIRPQDAADLILVETYLYQFNGDLRQSPHVEATDRAIVTSVLRPVVRVLGKHFPL